MDMLQNTWNNVRYFIEVIELGWWNSVFYLALYFEVQTELYDVILENILPYWTLVF